MILERSQPLETLASSIDGIEISGGRVILVRGEAGIGKSTLITQFLADISDRSHVLSGWCDDLLTPQPFGPIWDIGREEPSVDAALHEGDRRALMEAILQLLARNLRPTVLVVEDTQWADDATLDVIKFLGRRIARTNGILILTYRDGEVDFDHPLRRVIGGLPPQNLVRIQLQRLSAEGIASIIGDTPFDLGEVLSLTGGNPLFVTEVVASGVDAVPSSVQDSVLARASKLGPEARLVLEVVSVIPGEADRFLVDAILQPTDNQLSECVRQGLLHISSTTVSFPHELQRRAIEASLTGDERRRLNRLVLTELSDSVDPSRLVHHAREADDVESILAFAPRAARAAMEIESNREAVAHYRLLEPCLDRIPIGERAAILEGWARGEFYLDNPASLDLIDRAIDVRRSAHDEQALARTLTFAAKIRQSYFQNAKALEGAIEAVEILEPRGPTADLARAMTTNAFMNWLNYENIPVATRLIDQALEVAEETDDDEATISALTAKGSILHSGGNETGMVMLERSRMLAERSEIRYEEVRALGNMAGMAGDVRDIERASDYARRARDTAARYEMPAMEADAQATYAEFLLWKGAWDEAEDTASSSLDSRPSTAALAWRVLGTLQTRRGRSEARAAVERMWSLARTSNLLTNIDPAAALIGEYLWLSGDDDPVWVEQLLDVLASGLDAGRPWPSGALAFWTWKLGLIDTAPEGSADFYGWIIQGNYEKSAAFWHRRNIPYEEGLALMHGDESAKIEALHIFEELGASATAHKVRHALLDHGVKVPRGRSYSTRSHAAGLTARQAQVLDLLAEGLSNSEIADRLFISHRTVDNHVSAVLLKLDVPTRDAAVEAAEGQGFLTTPSSFANLSGRPATSR
jgi:DNA-binding CsgD family transcriptional regulator